MTKRTFGIAAALLALGTTAFAQAPGDLSPALPDTQSAPSMHDDAASGQNDQNPTIDDGELGLPSGLGTDTGTSPADRQYRQAIDEYKAGKLDDATKDLQGVLNKDPKNAQAEKLLAYTFLRQNKLADALPHLEATVKAMPQDVQTRDNLGKVYWALKRPADAKAQFKAVLAISPKDATALQALTPVKTTTTTTETAATQQDQKPEKSKMSAQDYAKQGEALLKANKFDEAMDAYNKAADLDSKNADLRLYIGEQYAKAGIPDKAIPAIKLALTMGTKHVFEAHTMLGQLYAPTDPTQAISEFALATQARPSDPAAWYNLGFLHAQAGDTADAKQDYQKVLDLKPADATLADHAKQNLAALGK